MKKARIFFLFLVFMLTAALFCSCGTTSDGSGGYAPGLGSSPDSGFNSSIGAPGASDDAGSSDYKGGDYVTEDGAVDVGSTDGSEGTPEEILSPRLPAGMITAGAFNDNDYYSLWKPLFEQGTDANGKFYEFSANNSWGFSSYSRLKITVTANDSPVIGATAVATAENGTALFTAVTDSNGVAYLFTDELNGNITVTSGENTASVEFTADSRELTLSLDGAVERPDVIEIMFVVDVTGSMGDELEFLKVELEDVIGRVVAANPGATVNLALLFYRDHGDQEVFKYFDFKNVSTTENLAAQQAAINSQSALGGGDWPEAVDEALEMAVEKQWLSSASTKIIFHVLDAPPHSAESNQTRFNAAVNKAAEKGIRYCPVICSGADVLTEYLVRQAAIYTGGTFIYVTDDSGIGNSHHDPNIPNVTVELLNSLMVRLVNGYHSGTFAPPVDWRQEIK